MSDGILTNVSQMVGLGPTVGYTFIGHRFEKGNKLITSIKLSIAIFFNVIFLFYIVYFLKMFAMKNAGMFGSHAKSHTT